MTCPRCGCPCAVRYREVPFGQPALFVCGKCIESLGLSPGGYTGRQSAQLARTIARGLHDDGKERPS